MITYFKYYFHAFFLISYLVFDVGPLLNARPSHVEHLQHLYYLHFNPKPRPTQQIIALSNPENINQENNIPPTDSEEQIAHEEELFDDDRPFLNVIKTVFTPLLAHYYFEKIIPQDPQTTSLEEQLEYIHMVSTFIMRLRAQYNSLSEPVQEFIKTPFAQEQSLIKLINKILVCLQSFFAERNIAYKAIKPQTPLVKELKKMSTEVSKAVDLVCQKIVQLNPYDI